MNKAYKIKRIADGKFSTGGYAPGFTKNGKTWYQASHLKSHLSLIGKSWRIYSGCELVVYDLIPSEEYTFTLDSYFENIKSTELINKLKGSNL